MNEVQGLIHQVYAAFNRRDIDGALAGMTDDVDWPKASEGGRVVGKQSIREYWGRQWAEFDPHVEPVEIIEKGADGADVRVHQRVRTLSGGVLSDGEVWHRYTLRGGLLQRMVVDEERPSFSRAH